MVSFKIEKVKKGGPRGVYSYTNLENDPFFFSFDNYRLHFILQFQICPFQHMPALKLLPSPITTHPNEKTQIMCWNGTTPSLTYLMYFMWNLLSILYSYSYTHSYQSSLIMDIIFIMVMRNMTLIVKNITNLCRQIFGNNFRTLKISSKLNLLTKFE